MFYYNSIKSDNVKKGIFASALRECAHILSRIFVMTHIFLSLSLQSNNVNVEDIFQPRVSLCVLSISYVSTFYPTFSVNLKNTM
jgi:hypothetical protein